MRSRHHRRAALAAALALVFVLPAQGSVLTDTTWAVAGDAKMSVHGVGREAIPATMDISFGETDFDAVDHDGRQYTGMYLMVGMQRNRWAVNYDDASRNTLKAYFEQWMEDQYAAQGIETNVAVRITRHKVGGVVRKGLLTIKQTTRFEGRAIELGTTSSGVFTMTVQGGQTSP